MKQCQPTECEYFKIRYERVWDKMPADLIVVKCPNRVGNGINCSDQ